MPRKILVTSALLYANGPMHIGHLVEYIQTDIFVRFMKLKGHEVIYVCADDTHGAPIQINAQKAGMKPEEMIKKFYKEHVRDFKTYGVKFDKYHTTHSDENKHFADLMFLRARANDYIYKKQITQLFCPKDEMFLPDRYVKGICPKCGHEDQYGDVCEKCGTTYKPTELKDAHCAICGTKPVNKRSEHYFFKLSAFKGQLQDWLKNPKLQKEIVNSVNQWITEGLQDWDITRDAPYFGFNIVDEENLFYYVWWDAPIGYIASAENYLKKKGIKAQDYWNDAEVIHFIGKDIIYFHFLFWPAVLSATGFNLPKQINVHGFLTVNGEKMSKSRGTFITAEEFAQDHEPENLRFYYAASLGRKLSDIDLNFDDFTARINNELVANIGNFCYRTLAFTEKNYKGEINGIEYESNLMRDMESSHKKIEKSYENLDFQNAVKEIMVVGARANKYFQDMEPWVLRKADKNKCQKVLGLCVNIAKNMAILMKPIIPVFSSKLEKQLKLKNLTWDDLGFDIEKHKLAKASILVKKLEDQKHKTFPFDLRTAIIKEVSEHPEADKLLKIKVDLGKEQRQIVAGLKPYYKDPQELVGKSIIVVTNLKPAKLRGEISQGMLLAASKDNVVKVIEPDCVPGRQVAPVGWKPSREVIKIDKFMKLNKLGIIKGTLHYENTILKVNDNDIKTDMPDGSIVR